MVEGCAAAGSCQESRKHKEAHLQVDYRVVLVAAVAHGAQARLCPIAASGPLLQPFPQLSQGQLMLTTRLIWHKWMTIGNLVAHLCQIRRVVSMS